MFSTGNITSALAEKYFLGFDCKEIQSFPSCFDGQEKEGYMLEV